MLDFCPVFSALLLQAAELISGAGYSDAKRWSLSHVWGGVRTSHHLRMEKAFSTARERRLGEVSASPSPCTRLCGTVCASHHFTFFQLSLVLQCLAAACFVPLPAACRVPRLMVPSVFPSSLWFSSSGAFSHFPP